VLWLLTGGLLALLTGRGLFGGDAAVALVVLVGFAGYGFVLWLFDRPVSSATSSPVSIERRQLLAGALMLVVSGGLAGRVIAGMTARQPPAGSAEGSATLPASWAGAAVPPGRPPPITAPDDFYVVSKNLADPVVDLAAWRLQVTGLVGQPLVLSYDALATLPSVHVIRTLECISNEVGGNLMSTGRWTGLRLRDLLRRAAIQDAATAIVFHSVDGYTETIALSKALDPSTLLAYQLDGQPLPTKHGFPVRVLGTGSWPSVQPA
jgi:DMSO/TMAO reductase YedYZ molybdopterin-dependent catalytic subunit